jgi:hypothetical protein
VDHPLPRAHGWFTVSEEESALRARLNPHGLTDLELFLYLREVSLIEEYDLSTEGEALAARAAVARLLEADPELRVATEKALRRAAARLATYSHVLAP